MCYTFFLIMAKFQHNQMGYYHIWGSREAVQRAKKTTALESAMFFFGGINEATIFIDAFGLNVHFLWAKVSLSVGSVIDAKSGQDSTSLSRGRLPGYCMVLSPRSAVFIRN